MTTSLRWCVDCRAGSHGCGLPFCECARSDHHSIPALVANLERSLAAAKEAVALDPSGLPVLLECPGTPSQVQTLNLFDPGDPTPPPRQPAPHHPGQGTLL